MVILYQLSNQSCFIIDESITEPFSKIKGCFISHVILMEKTKIQWLIKQNHQSIKILLIILKKTLTYIKWCFYNRKCPVPLLCNNIICCSKSARINLMKTPWTIPIAIVMIIFAIDWWFSWLRPTTNKNCTPHVIRKFYTWNFHIYYLIVIV